MPKILDNMIMSLPPCLRWFRLIIQPKICLRTWELKLNCVSRLSCSFFSSRNHWHNKKSMENCPAAISNEACSTLYASVFSNQLAPGEWKCSSESLSAHVGTCCLKWGREKKHPGERQDHGLDSTYLFHLAGPLLKKKGAFSLWR